MWDLALPPHTFQHTFPTRALPQRQTRTLLHDAEPSEQQTSRAALGYPCLLKRGVCDTQPSGASVRDAVW